MPGRDRSHFGSSREWFKGGRGRICPVSLEPRFPLSCRGPRLHLNPGALLGLSQEPLTRLQQAEKGNLALHTAGVRTEDIVGNGSGRELSSRRAGEIFNNYSTEIGGTSRCL